MEEGGGWCYTMRRVRRWGFCGEADSVRNLEVGAKEGGNWGKGGNIFQRERVVKICAKTENVAGDFHIADD